MKNILMISLMIVALTGCTQSQKNVAIGAAFVAVVILASSGSGSSSNDAPEQNSDDGYHWANTPLLGARTR